MDDGMTCRVIVGHGQIYFKITHSGTKVSTNRASTGNARDLFQAVVTAEPASFLRRQPGVIPVFQINILDWSAPIDIAAVVRLIIGTPFY